MGASCRADRLGEAIGMSRSQAPEFSEEFERQRIVEVRRSAQVETNIWPITLVATHTVMRRNS